MCTSKCKHKCPRELFDLNSEPPVLSGPVPAAVSSSSATIALDEDIGQSISRDSVRPSSRMANQIAPQSHLNPDPVPPVSPIIEPFASEIPTGTESNSPPPLPAPPSRRRSNNPSPIPALALPPELRLSPPPPTPLTAPTPLEVPPPPEPPLPSVGGSKAKTKSTIKKETKDKKKKRKRDEIDDIFG
jgi:hypothetical protein